jgi:hypothetical protein
MDLTHSNLLSMGTNLKLDRLHPLFTVVQGAAIYKIDQVCLVNIICINSIYWKETIILWWIIIARSVSFIKFCIPNNKIIIKVRITTLYLIILIRWWDHLLVTLAITLQLTTRPKTNLSNTTLGWVRIRWGRESHFKRTRF